MIAALPILIFSVLGLRWPGLFVAAVFFGYPAGIFSGMTWLTTVVSGLAAAVMISGFLTRHQTVSLAGIDFFFSMLLGLTAVSALWSHAPAPWVDLRALMIPVVALYVLIKLVFCFGDPDRRLTEFFAGMMVLGSVYALYVILLADPTSSRFKLEDLENIAVGLTQSLESACIVAFAYALSAGRRWRLLSLAALGLTGYAVILTGTRGAFLAIMAGGLFYVLRRFGVARLASGLLLAVPVGLLFVVVLVDPRSLGALAEIRVLNFSSYGGQGDASSSIRLLGYLRAWQIFADQPLLGAGIGSFNALTQFGYPHNIVLELLTNTGLAGMALVLLILFQVVAMLRDPQMDTPLRTCLIAVLFAALVHHQVSFSLGTGKPLYLFLVLPALLATRRTHPAPARTPQPAVP